MLAAADRVFIVGSADPPGLERLVRALGDLADTLPSVRPEVVLNRIRPTAGTAAEAANAVRRFTGIVPAVELPEDRGATDLAWSRGMPLSAVAPKSALRVGLTGLAKNVLSTRPEPVLGLVVGR